MPIDQLFSPALCSKAFRDADIRSKVLSMEVTFLPAETQMRAAKCTKIAKESTTLPYIRKRICKILGIADNKPLGAIEDKIL